MAVYGLIGRNIDYSFSKQYFTEKFQNEKKKHSYQNFDIEHLDALSEILSNTPKLKGLNVTIPYKESIIPFLDDVDEEAANIGAVNTIKIKSNGKLIGYNTDHYGFAKALEPFLPLTNKTALVLGTGGASKAIRYVLDVMGFDYKIVSRSPSNNVLTYKDLTPVIIKDHLLIINCTPLGTYPNILDCPSIPYLYLHKDHLLFDLIYNPTTTEFLKRGFAQGAQISNGYKMLVHQANKAWRIWNA